MLIQKTDSLNSVARHLRGYGPKTALIALGLALCAGPLFAQTESTPSASDLKKLSFDQLMDIEVTSVSKRPEKLSGAASAIQVITSEDIRRSGATSIPEALRLASNLEVAQIDSRQWAITARGFNNVFADKMLVLIDGRSVYTPLYAGVYWDAQDALLEDLDRIEVISGPGATQWGANAVNGVINITSKSAKDTQGGLLTSEGGTSVRDSFGARYGVEITPGLYLRVYGKYFDRAPSEYPNGNDSDDAWHMGQGGFRMDWDANTNDTLTLQGDIYNGAIGRAGPDDIGVGGGNVLGRWTHTLGENSDLKLQLYYDHTHRLIPLSFTQTLDTYDIDFQHRFPLGTAHDIVWGAGYRDVDDDIINTPANAFLPARVSRGSFSTFFQDEITVVKDLVHVTVGTKIEHNNYTGFEFEPSIRAAWTPGKKSTVWGAVSRAVRTPSRIDRDLYSPAEPPYRVAGGPDVVSETLIAYEVGYRMQITPQVSVSLATFYNDYNDLRSLEPLNPPAAFPIVISSGLQGSSSGAELTAEWRVTPSWRLRAGYTEMRVSSEPQPNTPDRIGSRSVALDPNHQGSLHSFYDISEHWEFDGSLRYVGQIGNQWLPGYTEMDLRLGWHPWQGWEFSVEGQNLLHDHHAEFNTPGTRREIPRSVYGKATWRF